MLIIFCRNRTTKTRSIAIVGIDEDTKVNFQKCECQTQSDICKIVAIEQKAGNARLNIQKLGGEMGRKWDLMGLTNQIRLKDSVGKVNNLSGIIRLSILFKSPRARQAFGGYHCKCKIKKEKHELACISNGHYGLFGQARVLYRKQMLKWYELRFGNAVEVVRGQVIREPFELGRPPSVQ
jgi:hypothetical protein